MFPKNDLTINKTKFKTLRVHKKTNSSKSKPKQKITEKLHIEIGLDEKHDDKNKTITPDLLKTSYYVHCLQKTVRRSNKHRNY